MIEIKFYRDGSKVYVNNPRGKTIEMSISKFEEILSGLPDIGEEDDDKVLTIVDGKPAWTAIPSVLPAIGADDEDKVLTVVSGEPTWAVIPEGIE